MFRLRSPLFQIVFLPNKKSGLVAHFLPTVTGQGKLAYPL